MSSYPKIRPLDFQPFDHNGQQMFLLRDPQRLAEQQLILPPILAQMTVYMDGHHDIAEIYRELKTLTGFQLPPGTIEDAIHQLDSVFLLNNENYRQKIRQLQTDFRNQPFRPMALADLSYPRDPQQLAKAFSEYGRNDDPQDAEKWKSWSGRGIVSPHIDYQRGGESYAKVWQRAQLAVQEADLVLMFATDHHGGLGSLTLTHKPYETPYGILPTDNDLVSALAAAIGEEEAFQLELNHRQEHSVELSAVWLHHVAGQSPPPMVPFLIGSFQHFVANNAHPTQDHKMERFIETLKAKTKGKKVLCVASVDMAHVGPAFGDEFDMDDERRQNLQQLDQSLIEAVTTGDVNRYYDEIAAVQDRNRICGFSPTYFMLRYMGETKGMLINYQQCSADQQDTSLVSISSILLD